MAEIPGLQLIAPRLRPQVEVHCYGCSIICLVSLGINFNCPKCFNLRDQIAPPSKAIVSMAMAMANPKVHGTDPTKLQVKCSNCSALLNVPHGLSRFECLVCHLQLCPRVNRGNSLSLPSTPPEEVLDQQFQQNMTKIDNTITFPIIREPPMRPMITVKDRKRVREIEQFEDCFILDFDPDEPFDQNCFSGLLDDQAGDEIDVLIARQKGKVAVRDFSHPRDVCANYPFEKTPHNVHCKKCYCYICDAPAPCKEWELGLPFRHCDATAEFPICGLYRNARKRRRSCPY